MDTIHIPLFPLNTVLFPGGVLPLRVFEARYLDMTRDCMKSGKPFGVCLIHEGSEVGTPAVPRSVGCTASITDWDMQQLGVLSLRTRGERRFRILSSSANKQGLLSAEVETIPPEESIRLPQRYAACAKVLRLVAENQAGGLLAERPDYDDAVWVSYRLAEILPVPATEKQRLLELSDTLERLATLQAFLDKRGLAD